MIGKLILIHFLIALCTSQILAIDYGTQYIKASLVNTGAGKSFTIVENPKSQRKFINSVLIILLSLASTMNNVSIRQTPYPKDHADLQIVSYILNFS